MSTPEADPIIRFAVMTLFPEAFSALTGWGVTGRAFHGGFCSLHIQDPRHEAIDRHGTVDDRPYGGGPGMVMQLPFWRHPSQWPRQRSGLMPNHCADTTRSETRRDIGPNFSN